ncbi:MAG: sigma-54 interaction domain-containing protein [Clostridium sp.]
MKQSKVGSNLRKIQNINDLSNSNLLELLVNQMKSVLVTDKEGRYVYVNKNWEEMIGFKLKDIKGKYVHDLVPDTKVNAALRGGTQILGIPISIRNIRGEQIQLFCSYYPLFEDGELIGCFVHAYFKDIQELLTLSAKVEDLSAELKHYQKELELERGAKYTVNNIVGNSPCIVDMKALICQAARSVSTVLIQGETGTGKELVAHSIHVMSNRSVNPFVKVNCAAIPAELIESEFFGYEGGAFTGAQRGGKKGKFELAHQGSLFLDEIHQLSLTQQPKLLRALQEREIERVGGAKSIPIDCRIIAATNVSLDDMVQEGTFREDLFYRLNVITITVPPLRERKEDIPLIAENLIEKLNSQMGLKVPGITDDAMKRLVEYHWPGNIRELQNVIERAMNQTWDEAIAWKHLASYFENKHISHNVTHNKAQSVRMQKKDLERQIILDALKESSGNKTQAAVALGISRTMLYQKIKEYQII